MPGEIKGSTERALVLPAGAGHCKIGEIFLGCLRPVSRSVLVNVSQCV